jgi:hypothetical protein
MREARNVYEQTDDRPCPPAGEPDSEDELIDIVLEELQECGGKDTFAFRAAGAR